MEDVQNTDAEVVSEDPWESAEAAFEAVPEVAEEVIEEKAPESHIEPEIPEYLKLDDLKVPHKYKDEVKARLQKVASDFEAKQVAAIEAVNQELGQNKEAVLGLVSVFKDLAQTPRDQLPSKIAGLIEQHGQHLGLDPAIAQNFKEVQRQQVQQEQQSERSIQSINQKYSGRMAQTQDPKEFMSLWEQADLEKSQVMENQMLSKMGMILKAYHDKYIEPDKKTLEEFKTKSQKEAEEQVLTAKTSSWSSATETLKSKYPDFEKYKSKIGQMIKDKRSLAAARDSLNEDFHDVEGRKDFLESLYLAVSHNDKVNTAKLPSQGGLPPTQKHVQTKKSGSAGDWDAVWENQKEQWG